MVGAILVPILVIVAGGSASATWSLVAVDAKTGRVGVVMASCVPAGVLGDRDQVLVPVVLIPGVGAAVAQGTIDPESPAGLRQLLTDGFDPQLAIDELLNIDDQPTVRQYGVVVLQQDGTVISTNYTGTDAESVAAEITGAGAAAQGVLMADERVASETLTAYEAALASGVSFEEALVAGLVAGSDVGGDRRCDEQTALFAHLAVAEQGDDPFRPSTLLTVTVDEGDGQNPVPLLAQAFSEGQSGWVDAGLSDPVGIPRIAVMAVGSLLAVAAFFVIRKGLGSPSARR